MNAHEIQEKVLRLTVRADEATLMQMLDAAKAKSVPIRHGTTRQAAEILGVHPRTVERLEKRGLLKAIRIGKRLRRWNLNEVEKLAAEGGDS